MRWRRIAKHLVLYCWSRELDQWYECEHYWYTLYFTQ